MTDIIITIVDGTAHLYQAPPGTRIEIRDYDVPPDWGDVDEDDCQPPSIVIKTDEDRLKYQSIILQR